MRQLRIVKYLLKYFMLSYYEVVMKIYVQNLSRK